MIIVRTIGQMQSQSRVWRRSGRRIGLVPTMGFLHEGHASLIRLATKRSDTVVLSIYVNPTQFGPQEDLEAYPRDFERDEALCRDHGVTAVFYPDDTEMYAPSFSTWVVEDSLSLPLCGQSRPTHFRGVTTVVTKLFNAVLPDVAVFGRKDAQQALIIERMVRDLNFPIEIVLGPTVREADGLALSSRNRYLSEAERARAVAIPRGLRRAQELYAAGERAAPVLCSVVSAEIGSAGGHVDYVACVSRSTLAPLGEVAEPALLAVAAFFGCTRLIDNAFLD